MSVAKGFERLQSVRKLCVVDVLAPPSFVFFQKLLKEN